MTRKTFAVATIAGLAAIAALASGMRSNPQPASAAQHRARRRRVAERMGGSCPSAAAPLRQGPAIRSTSVGGLPEIALRDRRPATILLAANYEPLWSVVAGTTVGMLLANVPVVLLGSRFAAKLPLKAARIAAACVFLALGLWAAVFGLGD